MSRLRLRRIFVCKCKNGKIQLKSPHGKITVAECDFQKESTEWIVALILAEGLNAGDVGEEMTTVSCQEHAVAHVSGKGIR